VTNSKAKNPLAARARRGFPVSSLHSIRVCVRNYFLDI
jgi:hypothetical protein